MVHARMACNAERNQVLFGIVTGVVAKLSVVDLHRAARLTPAIATQHLLPQSPVQHRIQPHGRGLGPIELMCFLTEACTECLPLLLRAET